MWMQKTGCVIQDTWFMIYRIQYTGYRIHDAYRMNEPGDRRQNVRNRKIHDAVDRFCDTK